MILNFSMVCPPFNETECKLVCTLFYLRKFNIKYNLENNMFSKVIHTYVVAYTFWWMFYFRVYINSLLYFLSLQFWIIYNVPNNFDSSLNRHYTISGFLICWSKDNWKIIWSEDLSPLSIWINKLNNQSLTHFFFLKHSQIYDVIHFSVHADLSEIYLSFSEHKPLWNFAHAMGLLILQFCSPNSYSLRESPLGE